MHPDDSPPREVRDLLDRRTRAREERRWDEADALRDEIAGLGWEVQDAAGGSSARPLLPPQPAATGYADPNDLASLLDEPATVDASLQLLAEDHPEDLHRFLAALELHPPAPSFEIVIVANAPTFDADAIAGHGPTVLRTSSRLGWADARNLGLRRSRGEVTVVIDTSVEPIGEFLEPLLATFAEPTVGIAGPWGVTSDDGRQFENADPGEVDAIEGYCLAVRREALRTVVGFDRRFRFYRNADLDLSFAIRDAGWRAVRTEQLPLELHEHRGWTSLPDAERDRLSRRNFYRFLDHWGDRRDLLVRRAGQ